MYKLGVGLNIFDDPYGLERILSSNGFYKNVDKIFLIDGKYKNRDDRLSYDEVLVDMMVSRYRKIHYIKLYDNSQVDKRNRYWQLAQEYNMDYMLVLDSDEYAVIDDTFQDTLHELQSRDAQCFPVFQSHPQVIEMPRPRIFKAPFDFRHIQSENSLSHGSLWRGDHEIINEMHRWFKDHPKRTGIPGIKLYHDKNFRTEDRVIRDRIYYDENKYR
jgi:hypothetical protein